MNEKGKEKCQILIFIAIAYGLTFLMGLLMWYGNANGTDLSIFPDAQMFYPAAGVILAYLVTEKEKAMPKLFFGFFLFLTALFVITAAASVLLPDALFFAEIPALAMYTGMEWLLISQILLIGSSVPAWIFLLTAGKERRKNAGLQWRNWKASAVCIAVFLILYFGRTAISCVLSGQMNEFAEIFTSQTTWIMLFSMPVNFLLVFLAFFGEEYGWRYYLQPYLQNRFGLRRGVIILGIVWGLWHLPINFFYYSPDAGLISAAGQQITCISLGIFFAWAYMKTENIWVPVVLHFLNNNLIPVISGNYSADVLQNQAIAWSDLLPALIINGLLFGSFLLAKEFRNRGEGKKDRQ